MTTYPTTMRNSGFLRNEPADNGNGGCLQTADVIIGNESEPAPVALIPAVLP